jgi:hypothetical protein
VSRSAPASAASARVAHVDGIGFDPLVLVLVLGAVVFTLSAYVEELLFRVLMLGGLVRLTGRRRLRAGGQRAVAGGTTGDHRADPGRHGTGSPFSRYFQ